MQRMFVAVTLACTIAMVMARTVNAAPAGGDCSSSMYAMAAAESDVQSAGSNVSGLEASINDPSWDSTADGWMIFALAWAMEDLNNSLINLAQKIQAMSLACYA